MTNKEKKRKTSLSLNKVRRISEDFQELNLPTTLSMLRINK
jgi:hypothetical protein